MRRGVCRGCAYPAAYSLPGWLMWCLVDALASLTEVSVNSCGTCPQLLLIWLDVIVGSIAGAAESGPVAFIKWLSPVWILSG